jgi:hypothetical protein
MQRRRQQIYAAARESWNQPDRHLGIWTQTGSLSD